MAVTGSDGFLYLVPNSTIKRMDVQTSLIDEPTLSISGPRAVHASVKGVKARVMCSSYAVRRGLISSSSITTTAAAADDAEPAPVVDGDEPAGGGVIPNLHSTLARRSRTLSNVLQRGLSCSDMTDIVVGIRM